MRQKGLQEKPKSKPTCSPNAVPAARSQNHAGENVQWTGVVVPAVDSSGVSIASDVEPTMP